MRITLFSFATSGNIAVAISRRSSPLGVFGRRLLELLHGDGVFIVHEIKGKMYIFFPQIHSQNISSISSYLNHWISHTRAWKCGKLYFFVVRNLLRISLLPIPNPPMEKNLPILWTGNWNSSVNVTEKAENALLSGRKFDWELLAVIL